MTKDRDRATVIQVVPRRSTQPDGVADYALVLGRALRSYKDVDSVFLVGTSPAMNVPPVEDGWKTVCVRQCRAHILADTIKSLLDETKAQAVLLHLSGYGYEKRGVPLWLVRGLKIWSDRAGRVPLVTIFHELYATGRPWQSSFWLSPIQKLIARSILNMSSNAITTTNRYRDCLVTWRNSAPIRCMPVLSNVGEPGCGLLPGTRAASAVVFGLAGVEKRVFGSYRSDVERIVVTMGIKKIHDIGPRFTQTPSSLAGIPLISMGSLPPLAVSELLQHARFGFVAYPLEVLAKSGVFAAYAAHGVIPIVLSQKPGSFDGLQAGRHFIDGIRLEGGMDVRHLAFIQSQLFDWYAAHSSQIQASFIEQSIKKVAANDLSLDRISVTEEQVS